MAFLSKIKELLSEDELASIVARNARNTNPTAAKPYVEIIMDAYGIDGGVDNLTSGFLLEKTDYEVEEP
jgi:hypothetical protein